MGLRLSNSKLNTWLRCAKKFDYKYNMRLEPRARSLPLERGSWIHELLQHYYDGEDWKARHQELSKHFYTYPEEVREELGDLDVEVYRIMRSYISQYKQEDKDLIVVDSELDELITMPSGVQFNFIIDLVVEDNEGLWLWDHKTVKNFMDADYMLLDAQLTRYFWCAEKMGYKPLRGVMFNEIRTKPPTIPKVLKNGGLSQAQNIDTNLRTYQKAIHDNHLDPSDYRDTLLRLAQQPEKFFRRTRIPKDTEITEQMMIELDMGARQIERAIELNEFPRSPNKQCPWDCEYLSLCQVDLYGGDISSIVKHDFKERQRRE